MYSGYTFVYYNINMVVLKYSDALVYTENFRGFVLCFNWNFERVFSYSRHSRFISVRSDTINGKYHGFLGYMQS